MRGCYFSNIIQIICLVVWPMIREAVEVQTFDLVLPNLFQDYFVPRFPPKCKPGLFGVVVELATQTSVNITSNNNNSEAINNDNIQFLLSASQSPRGVHNVLLMLKSVALVHVTKRQTTKFCVSVGPRVTIPRGRGVPTPQAEKRPPTVG